jgi:hypothetical protein
MFVKWSPVVGLVLTAAGILTVWVRPSLAKLNSGLVEILGYKPSAAAAALIGVSNTRAIYGADRIKHMNDLAKALKLPRGAV